MSKYSNKQKLEVVKGVMERGMSHQAAGNMIGACKGDVQKRIKLYREHDAEGLSMKKGSYDGQFKVEAVEYIHKNHLSIREVTAKFGIPSHPIVARWERIYYEEGEEALFRNNRSRKKKGKINSIRKPKLDKNLEEDLITEIQRLRMENAYLKKLNALVQKRIQHEKGKKHLPSQN